MRFTREKKIERIEMGKIGEQKGNKNSTVCTRTAETRIVDELAGKHVVAAR